MAINVGGTPVKQVFVGSTPVREVWVGSEKIWPTREVVTLSGSGNTPRDQLRAALTARGLDYKTVAVLPFELDTSQVTGMNNMFNGYAALTAVPDLDTSQVTDMTSMFLDCSSLTNVPDLDTSQVTEMANMFYGCAALTAVPDLDASIVTSAGWMFNGCSSLTDGQVRLIRPDGTLPAIRDSMIGRSGLTREPFFLPDGTPIP